MVLVLCVYVVYNYAVCISFLFIIFTLQFAYNTRESIQFGRCMCLLFIYCTHYTTICLTHNLVLLCIRDIACCCWLFYSHFTIFAFIRIHIFKLVCCTHTNTHVSIPNICEDNSKRTKKKTTKTK